MPINLSGHPLFIYFYVMHKGFVYILFNTKTNRVKVGMTLNHVMDRVREINRTNPDKEYYNGDKNLPLSFWQYKCSYQTYKYEEVEKLAHKYLNEYLDKNAPIGEVFDCSLDIAINAVEDALKDLELLKGVKVNYSKPTS